MYSLKLVSHACVYFDLGEIKLLTDPWLFGECFNKGWKLLKTTSKQVLSKKEIEEITHIWISHEHPDHFHCPSLRYLISKIPKKNDVQIITKNDSKSKNEIYSFLVSIGFSNIKLLNHLEFYKLNKTFSLRIYLHRHVDSALLIFKNGKPWIFNMNDCELYKKECQYITKRFGSFPLLLNQFSIAGYNGIINDKSLRKKKRLILEKMIMHHSELKSHTTIPFASFCRFSSSDNQFLNKWHNNIEDVNKVFLKAKLNLFCLKPPSKKINLENIDNKRKQPDTNLKFLNIEIDNFGNIVDFEILQKTLLNRLKKLITSSNKFLFNFVERYLYILVKDLNVFIEIDLKKLVIKKKLNTNINSYLEINSQPLFYAFQYPFGIQTLGISGRYKFVNYKKVPYNWRLIRTLSSLDNNHIPLRLSTLFRTSLYSGIFKRRKTLIPQLFQLILRFFKI